MSEVLRHNISAINISEFFHGTAAYKCLRRLKANHIASNCMFEFESEHMIKRIPVPKSVENKIYSNENESNLLCNLA